MNKEKKVLQGIKRLVPHHRLPLNLNTFRLLRNLLVCHSVGYGDEVIPRHTESLDVGNVMRSEDYQKLTKG